MLRSSSLVLPVFLIVTAFVTVAPAQGQSVVYVDLEANEEPYDGSRTVAPAQGRSVVYVDLDANEEPYDGSSWCHAYQTLQQALAGAGSGTTIRVANGTYLPGTFRASTFELVNNVTVEGGYAGCGAPDPDERDILWYQTILSGEIGAPDDSDKAS